ncbi:inorganic phosphate transporter, partial [bacterium]
MPSVDLLLILVIVAALGFDYINGFHDTANAIATVVSTRVLSPRQAIVMAAGLNFVGALGATHVAKTISSGIVAAPYATETLALAAVIGAIVWNLVTWFFGIPSSSSHALIGGLVGAGLVSAGSAGIQWNGVVDKVILPLVITPFIGFGASFLLMKLIEMLFARSQPQRVSHLFRRLQILSAACMAYSHGRNDAQKSMGIITLALVARGFLEGKDAHPPIWVIIACASFMALGTASGGWRIMKTMGHRIIRLEPVNGFAAEAGGAVTILGASQLGMPVSTTHIIASSIFGVGAAKRLSAVRWGVAVNMVIAWVLTIPASAAVGAVAFELLR